MRLLNQTKRAALQILRTHGISCRPEDLRQFDSLIYTFSEKCLRRIVATLDPTSAETFFNHLEANDHILKKLRASLGFGYFYSVLHHRIASQSGFDAGAAEFAGVFNSIIAIVDFLVDDTALGDLVFSLIDEQFIGQLIRTPALGPPFPFPDLQASPGTHLSYILLPLFHAFASMLTQQVASDTRPWPTSFLRCVLALREVEWQLYKNRTVLDTTTAGLAKAKSILPFQAIAAITGGPMPDPSTGPPSVDPSSAFHLASSFGQAVAIADDIADFYSDVLSSCYNSLFADIVMSFDAHLGPDDTATLLAKAIRSKTHALISHLSSIRDAFIALEAPDSLTPAVPNRAAEIAVLSWLRI
jgi:hypothetical protein